MLCSNCHKDNALLKPGTTGISSLSEVIHGSHANKTNNCYKCHPGPNTQCFRDVMSHIGIVCQDCHGTMEHIAGTINLGREAWLEEPDCGISICHGPAYASDTSQLFRNSKGHGGLYCSACHGSPHAILPTLQANDNIQNTMLQGYPGTLNKCSVCHGVTPFGAGPHGINASETEYDASSHLATQLDDIFPNPAVNSATISFMLDKEARIMLQVLNSSGKTEKLLINKPMDPGSYKVSFDIQNLASGTYFCLLKAGNTSFTKKVLVIK